MRWNLLDKFEVIKKGRYASAVKTFKGDEDFFQEHFPGKPLVPEPFYIEMTAQSGGVLFGLRDDFKKEVVLAKIAKARFLKPVSPPCQIRVEARIDDEREEGAWISGTVSYQGQTIAEARILLVTVDSLIEPVGNKRIVFNEDFIKHFDIYRIADLNEHTPKRRIVITGMGA